jgi:hypothetical protein
MRYAKLAATVDFPTPPFPLPTAMMFLADGRRFLNSTVFVLGAGLFDAHELQSDIIFSKIILIVF